MKYWIHTIIIMALGFLLCQWFPWWTVSIVAIVSAFVMQPKFWLAGMFGFLAGFLLWIGVAIFLDIENQQILSTRIAPIFNLGSGSVLMAITGVLGGLLAALGSLVGSSLRTLLLPNK